MHQWKNKQDKQRAMGSVILDSVTKEGLSNVVICGQKPE